MTDKVHDISSAPKDAPRNDATDADTSTKPTPGRVKTFFANHKKFFLGMGTGLAVGAAAVTVAKVASEEEDEEVPTLES